ncbi:hypothetical protein K502DRAFT_361509 [Neoconidiobolus thromboides FSU 785]|nr:hypothetical protein K502DRAFT_361509 [Neoconidiobolus thromboides FSU 785]
MVKINSLSLSAILLSVCLAQNNGDSSNSNASMSGAMSPSGSTSASASTPQQSSVPLSERDKCLINCGFGNVVCQNKCDGIQTQTQDDARKNIACVSKCQTDPDNKDNDKMKACLSSCSSSVTSSASDSSSNSTSGDSKSASNSAKKNSTNSTSKSDHGNSSNSLTSSPVYMLSTTFIIALGLSAFSNL